MVTANVRQTPPAPFRLEPRHVQHHKNPSKHHPRSSKMLRRNLQDPLTAASIPIAGGIPFVAAAPALNARAESIAHTQDAPLAPSYQVATAAAAAVSAPIPLVPLVPVEANGSIDTPAEAKAAVGRKKHHAHHNHHTLSHGIKRKGASLKHHHKDQSSSKRDLETLGLHHKKASHHQDRKGSRRHQSRM
ncbi:hypothetical protein BGX31_001668 [Mortierella sp. GBA43]|nr:hypothetical protein BGX31_001668 [Mortierella sp. GBA43]